MFGTSAYVIRTSTPEDAEVLDRLAGLDSSPTPSGRALIGEIGGRPAAALFSDGRVVADPFEVTGHLIICLRLQAAAISAHERTPSLADRLRAAMPMPAAASRARA